MMPSYLHDCLPKRNPFATGKPLRPVPAAGLFGWRNSNRDKKDDSSAEKVPGRDYPVG